MGILIPEKSPFVIIGAWNPSIINPTWLKNEFPDLIEEDKFPMTFIPYPFARIQFKIKDILIEPVKGRLLITPIKRNKKIFTFISKLSYGIVDKLPHTPIEAVGHNFTYKLENKQHFLLDQFIAHSKQNKFYTECSLPNFIRSQIKHSFSYPDYRLNISYDNEKDINTISFNYHYDVSITEKTLKAIKELPDNYVRSKELMSKLIGK